MSGLNFAMHTVSIDITTDLRMFCLLLPLSIYLFAGITCFINRQLIYNFPEQIFTEAGVISIEHADFDGTLSYIRILFLP